MMFYLKVVLLFLAFFSISDIGRGVNVRKLVKNCFKNCGEGESSQGQSSSRQADSPGNSADGTPLALREYQLMADIGKGGTGIIILGQHKRTHQYYAIKTMSKSKVVSDGAEQNVLSEKRILQSINFPFVIKMYNALKDNSNLYLIMEYVCGGDFLTHLLSERGQDWNELHIRFYAAQLVLALEYLHSRSIIHGDMKLENILMDEDGYIKLADFGSAKMVGDGLSERVHASVPYMAPEIIQKEDYGTKVDCWALGVLIYELITGSPPFGQSGQTKDRILTQRVKYPSYFSPELIDLIRHLLKKDPAQRYDMTQVKRHLWFTKHIHWDQIYNKQMAAPFKPTCTEYTTPMTPDQIERAIGPISSTEEYGSQFYEF